MLKVLGNIFSHDLVHDRMCTLHCSLENVESINIAGILCGFYLNIMEHNFRVEINAVALEIFCNLAQQQHLGHGEKIGQLHHLCLNPL